MAALKNNPPSLLPSVDLLDLSSEVLPSSSFSYALINSDSAIHTALSSSFLLTPNSSLTQIGQQLTAANGTSIPSDTSYWGKISSSLSLDQVFGYLLTIPFHIACLLCAQIINLCYFPPFPLNYIKI